MAELTGVSLTTSSVREMTGEIEEISKNISSITSEYNNTLTTLTGQSEGGAIEKTKIATEQMFDAFGALCKGFLRIGLHIGDYLNMLLSQDSNLAEELRNKIES